MSVKWAVMKPCWLEWNDYVSKSAGMTLVPLGGCSTGQVHGASGLEWGGIGDGEDLGGFERLKG